MIRLQCNDIQTRQPTTLSSTKGQVSEDRSGGSLNQMNYKGRQT